MLWQDFTTDGGVTIQRFASHLHNPDSVSAEGGCAQGGVDTCHSPALFSVTSNSYNISACEKHIYGALRDATRRQRHD